MPGPEWPAHGLAGRGDGYPLNKISTGGFLVIIITESEMDGINSGRWYNYLPIGIYH